MTASSFASRIAQPAALALAALVLFQTSAARATSMTWNGTTGNINTSTKWSPQQVPNADDDLLYPGATTFTLTIDSSVANVLSHTYRNTVNATLTVTSPHSVADAFSIATFSGDNATVHLGSGNLTVDGTVSMGSVGGSTGTMTIDGSDAFLTITGASSDFSVGGSGIGSATVTGGGDILVDDDVIIGAGATGSGTMTLSGGSGSIPFLNVSNVQTTNAGGGDIIVGNSGSGIMNLVDGGFAHAARDFKIANSSGETGAVTLTGFFSFLSSRITAGRNLDVARNDNVLAAGTATLTINSSTIVSIDGQTRIGDPNGGSGTVILADGLLVSDGGINVQSTGTISGTGEITGNIANSGHITPTGTDGLTLNGILSNTTNLVSGTKIVFGPNGGYLGSGLCQADISGDASTSIEATGNLSIGRNSTTGYFFLGALDVGPQDVTLVDSNGAVLGGPTTMETNGSITCAAGIGNQNGATIRGQGALIGNVTNAGVLDPEDPSGLGGGLMTVQGNLSFNPSGSFEMTIGDTPPTAMHDRVNVTGTAAFNGTMKVHLANGFVPRVGEQFIAINATGGRSGTFTTIVPPTVANAPCNDVTFVMVYSTTAAIVLIRPPLGCTALGDLNSNGGCDLGDIPILLDALLDGPYNACADLDGNCVNDGEDIQIFVTCFL